MFWFVFFFLGPFFNHEDFRVLTIPLLLTAGPIIGVLYVKRIPFIVPTLNIFPNVFIPLLLILLFPQSADNPIWSILGVPCRNEWEQEGTVLPLLARSLPFLLLIPLLRINSSWPNLNLQIPPPGRPPPLLLHARFNPLQILLPLLRRRQGSLPFRISRAEEAVGRTGEVCRCGSVP